MNHNLQLLQSLYTSTSGKYRKFKHRFDKAIQNGRFYQLNKRKQSSLVSRLKKLYERLRSLHTQLRLAGVGAGLALTLAISNPTQAQSSLGPFERNDAMNPMPPPIMFSHPRPAVVDIDNDGDLDLFIGTHTGEIEFHRNDSPPNSVNRFIKITGSANPLESIDKGYEPALAFTDVDADGDFDMLMGNQAAATFFFENTGSPTNPVFTERTTPADNPFFGIEGTGNIYGFGLAIPTFVDFDGDTDMDLFIGSSYVNADGTPMGAVEYHENVGGVYTNVSDHYLASILGSYSEVAIAFADMDEDGDMDAFVGVSGSGMIRVFRHDSEDVFIQVYNDWDPVSKLGNPFNNIYFTKYASPIAADFDDDGDLDFLVATGVSYYYNEQNNSNIRYIENTDGEFTLAERTDLNISPFGGVDVGREAAPVFTDLDGDGDLDAVIGAKYSVPDLFVYINDNGKFTADRNHPLIGVAEATPYPRQDIIPVFVDIDHDDDQDLFICSGYEIKFFRNNAGTFVATTSPLDPSSLNEVSIAFIDVDNDTDFDAFVSSDQSVATMLYFKNQGTNTNPNFVSATPPAPFDTFVFENTTNVSAVDLDNDGDLDLTTAETYYNGWYGDSDASRTWYFENNGDGTFSQESTPLIGPVPPLAFTSFADIDGDGDLDAFVGNGHSFDFPDNGRVYFLENTNPPPVTELNNSTLEVSGGEPTILDPLLTITDPDNDDIALATVTISDFVSGDEELGFDDTITDDNGITGTFDSETGILTFNGKASIDVYQDLLRSVTIDFTGTVPGGRKSNADRKLDLAQDVTFQVRDTDFTLTTVSIVSLTIVPGVPGSEIIIYNGFSPNQDDTVNPYFRIANIEAVSPDNKVTIFNRWGDAVFTVSNYNNSQADKRFEGNNDNGKELPAGTYFYKIEITGKTLTGYLSLKR